MNVSEIASFVIEFERAVRHELPALLSEWELLDGEERSDAATQLRLLLVDEEEATASAIASKRRDLADRLVETRTLFVALSARYAAVHRWLTEIAALAAVRSPDRASCEARAGDSDLAWAA
ncbi:hypothetical protein [Vulgatibacter sp.]|uniref:hypothetical protein n=1 Tax=Vulgatibacter sp. TaxID=1971226 RepID=UPI0035630AF4